MTDSLQSRQREAELAQHEVETVLVIDNDPVAQELMTRYLSKEGVRVETASGGEQGLEQARTLRPLAIFLDVVMPGMDGWEVLMALKGDQQLSSIPVVMLTMVDERSKGMALGVTDYLLKPPTRSRLAALVREFRQGSTSPCEEIRPENSCPVSASPAAPGGDASGRRVLIVEDHPTNREMLGRTMRKQGWQVVEAEDGQLALDRVAEKRPDLILLDLMLPVMDGMTFLQELRKVPEYSSIPIVVLTAKELTNSDRQELGKSVHKILQKGAYSREELLQAIAS